VSHPVINPGQGCHLQVTISAALTTVAQQVELTGPSGTVDSIEKTIITDVSKRYRPGLPDGGTISGKGYYDPLDTTHLFMEAQMVTPSILACKIIYSDTGPSSQLFNAFVTKWEKNGMSQGENLGVDFELKLDGLPGTPS
jgi:hypothetical protein